MFTDIKNAVPDLSKPLRVKPGHRGSTFMIDDLENVPEPQKHIVTQWGVLRIETGVVELVVDEKQEAEDACEGGDGCIVIKLEGEYFA